MGGGIAQVVAASGRRVSLHDAQSGATDRALDTMRKSLAKLEEKGGPAAQEVFARVEPVEGLVQADLMIEAVVEDAEVKEDLRASRCRAAGGGGARFEHVVHSHRVAGCCDRTSRQGDRDAFLQSGARPETR